MESRLAAPSCRSREVPVLAGAAPQPTLIIGGTQTVGSGGEPTLLGCLDMLRRSGRAPKKQSGPAGSGIAGERLNVS